MDSLQVKPAAAPDPTKPAEGDVTPLNSGGMRVDIKPAPVTKPEEKKDAPAGDRPAWLPEKFKSAEDLAKAYSELEKKQGTKPEEKKDETKPEEKKDAPSQDEAKDVLKQAGLDMVEFDKEYREKGELSPASYEKLTKAGFPKTLVDAYIAGQQAIGQQQIGAIYAEAGGTAESYKEMVEWAASNLSTEEVETYNKAIDTGDLGTQKLAARDLRRRFEAENGVEPKLRSGSTRSSGDAADVFESMQELANAMKDPKYKAGDPAYHRYIDQKLARSNIK